MNQGGVLSPAAHHCANSSRRSAWLHRHRALAQACERYSGVLALTSYASLYCCAMDADLHRAPSKIWGWPSR